MKNFSYFLSMLGYSPVEGTCQALNLRDAKIVAIIRFLIHNGIEDDTDDNFTMDQWIQFYAPTVKRIK